MDNQKTSLNGKNIRLLLIQNIVLKDNYGRVKQLNRTITKLNYRNVYPKRQSTRSVLELPIIDYNNPTLKYLDKCKHINQLKNSDLVSNLQASTRSDLINCSYLLKIKSFYNGFLMLSRTPEAILPLAINIPDVRVNISDYIPTRWNPSVQPLTKFDFPLPTAEDLGIQIQKEPIIQET